MRACRLAVATCLFLHAPTTLATPPETEVGSARDAARALAEEGLALIDGGQLEAGIDKLLRAEAMFHAPTHHLFLARAYAQLGKLGRAESHYRRLVDEALPNYAPDAFREAQELGRQELAVLGPRVPHVRVLVTGAKPGDVEVEVDGVRVARWSDPIPVDPGAHRIAVTAAGSPPRHSDVSLLEGAAQTVRFSFGEPSPPARPDPLPEASSDAWSGDGRSVAAATAFGVGGIGLVVGAVAGALSLDKVGDLEERCPSKACAPEDEALADDARALGTVSTVGFVVGGVGATVGLVVLLWPSGDGGRATPSAPAWTLQATHRSILLRGSF